MPGTRSRQAHQPWLSSTKGAEQSQQQVCSHHQSVWSTDPVPGSWLRLRFMEEKWGGEEGTKVATGAWQGGRQKAEGEGGG